MNEEKITETVEQKSNTKIPLIIAFSCIAVAIIAIIVSLIIFLPKNGKGNDSSSDTANPVSVSQTADGDSEVSKTNSKKDTDSKKSDSDEDDLSEDSDNTSKNNGSTDNPKSDNNTSTSSKNNSKGNSTSAGDDSQTKKSTTPEITSVAQMANDIFVVTGVCSLDTETIVVSGDGVAKTEITPVKGKNKSYFFGQVNVTSKEYFIPFTVQAQEKGLSLSDAATKTGIKEDLNENLMMLHEYTPFFGTKGRIHYYSALLSYSLSDVITTQLKATGKTNISKVVDAANDVGAEVIYLVAPSSAEIYPETIPSGYSKAKGETVFSAFNIIATDAGAKVIYPADTMKAHKNDGEGYDIYLNTDSHWSAYGAYWALSDLMNYISADFPAAKPRTVSEMEFYTTELCGGDAFFTYTDRGILETSRGTGYTTVTKIKELTTLYSKTMPTNTLKYAYKNGIGADIFNAPEVDKKQTVKNSNGAGLPTAMVVRDSFGVTPFDMFNDRFSTVWWSLNGEIDVAHKQTFFDDLKANKPDYVIYIVSERNLSKIIVDNLGMSLPSFVK